MFWGLLRKLSTACFNFVKDFSVLQILPWKYFSPKKTYSRGEVFLKNEALYFSLSFSVMLNLSHNEIKEKRMEVKEAISFDEIRMLSIIVSKWMSFFKKEDKNQVTVWATPGANRAPIGNLVKQKREEFILTTKNF